MMFVNEQRLYPLPHTHTTLTRGHRQGQQQCTDLLHSCNPPQKTSS